MMKHEFEELFGSEVKEGEYNKIETVYTYYPGIETKNDIVTIYKIGGILLIDDMLNRAESIFTIEDKINELNADKKLLTTKY